MDVANASDQIDRLIERRANSRDQANAVAGLWAASERRHREKRRRENAAAWYEFHLRLAGAHARIAADHEARALKLLEDERKETA